MSAPLPLAHLLLAPALCGCIGGLGAGQGELLLHSKHSEWILAHARNKCGLPAALPPPGRFPVNLIFVGMIGTSFWALQVLNVAMVTVGVGGRDLLCIWVLQWPFACWV